MINTRLIPSLIKNSFTNIKVIKKEGNKGIFSGKENKTKKIKIIKIVKVQRVKDQFVMDSFNSIIHARKFIEDLKTEYAPKLYEYFEIDEGPFFFMVSIEKKYEAVMEYKTKINKKLLDTEKIKIDITEILTHLHSEGKGHGDVALRNICFNRESGKYILIDWDNFPTGATLTVEEELKKLQENLNRIDNKISRSNLSSD